ncbi:MAG: glycosyltransferase [Candidatus Omnitrophica bacterium]|jgi:glycosyltransferase involved in cell wall biosynthesis|nr:glycosyltransferase [Candidatus Omnitrophota bacterium]
MKDIKEKISVIMPAFNEASRIALSIEETCRTMQDTGCPWELIVVDDGSVDNTFEQASLAAPKYPGKVIVRKNPRNIGKGRALRQAIRLVKGDYTVFLDADLDLHPAQINTLFDIMRLDNADVVIGSKMHPNSKVDYPWHRKLVSSVYYSLVKMLFGLPCRDTQTGLKLFKTEVLRRVFPRLLVKKFAFDIELLVNIHHLGYKIADAPIVVSPQIKFGVVNPESIWVTLWDTLAVFYRMKILKYYDRIHYYRRKNLAKEFRRMRR